ncbi:MAG: ATP-binding protein, partial [Anaerolineae bacterium]|nr:ATP-binding protein [Anaerolineae bacterium]
LQVSVFDCVDLVTRARDLMKSTARAHGHQITFEPPERPAHARADFEQSLAILIGLLDNAIRYTPDAATISVSIDHLGSHVLVSVVDTGIGLSPSDLANVGKPYWRATHQPVVQENPGSGLRLYLAEQIARLQGGELIFSGELDKGSTFSFTLPVVDESSEAL